MAAKWPKVFCTEINVAYHVFHYWYGVYRSEQKSPGSFILVNVTPLAVQEQIILKGHSGLSQLIGKDFVSGDGNIYTVTEKAWVTLHKVERRLRMIS